MSKRQLIDEILRVNRTATPEFLAKFDENALKAYLDRVCMITSSFTERVKTRVAERNPLAA
ncbi:MAG: hypothetical protein FWD61_10835 [Phycisphaerales bacterium]|nr:hypothetical protein [Phycisphaerales bacterium]